MSYLVIECQSGSESDEISRTDVGQLATSMAWFEGRYDSPCKGTPVLVHPSRRLHGKASASSATRVITKEKLDLLKGHVLSFAQAIAASGTCENVTEIGLRLETAHLNGKQLLLVHSLPTESS
jgi:hypothetical protein